MAAEITLFANTGRGGREGPQIATGPVLSKTATFTAAAAYVMRVYANGGAVALTVNGITWTVPSGTVEYFGIDSGNVVTVA